MGEQDSPSRGPALSDSVIPATETLGLSGKSFDLEVAAAAASRRRNKSSRAGPAGTSERCRSLLDALLRPGWPEQAAGWAEALIAEFGSLPAALAVGTSDRARVVGPAPARFLAKVQTGLLHCLRLPIAGRPVVSTSKQLLDYLKADMTNLLNERFRVLFLTSQNELITDDLVWEGTVGEAPAYPREVVKRALEVGATGIILVHNHPSGSHQPSQGDIDATCRIATAASLMGICLHDHIVISRSGWSSFRRLGYLDPVFKSPPAAPED